MLSNRTYRLTAVCVAAVLSVLFLLRVQIGNGFNVLTSVPYDGTIEVSILEHWYNVLRGFEPWNRTSYFFPYPDTLGYNDGYLIYGVIFSAFRFAGVDPFRASEFVNATIRLVGFLAFYAFAVDVVALPAIWAILGAIVFTISSSAYLHALHQQLLTVCFAPLLFWLCWKAWARLGKSNLPAALWGSAAACFYAAWLLTAFYMAWFTTLFAGLALLAIGGTAAIQGKPFRPVLRRLAAWPVAVTAAVLAAGLAPFLIVYLPKARETGQHSFAEAMYYSPAWLDLLHLGDGNVIGGFFDRFLGNPLPPDFADIGEHTVGMAPLLLLLAGLAALGVWKPRSQPGFRLRQGIAVAVLLSLVLCLHVGSFTLWYWVYRFVPGAATIRVVSRYLLFLDFPIVLLAMIFLADRAKRWPAPILIGLSLLLLAEEVNVHGSQMLDRSAGLDLIAGIPAAPADCRVFYMLTRGNAPREGTPDDDAIYHHNVDAMFISEMRVMPTINGISTFDPPDARAYRHVPASGPMIARYAQQHRITKGLCGLDLATSSWREGLPALATLPPDGVIRFGGDGKAAEPYQSEGWSDPEPEGQWTDGKTAALAFLMPETASLAGDLLLTVDATPFAPPTVAPSPVTVSAGDRQIARWQPAPGQHVFEANIPAAALASDRRLTLRFDIETPASPRQLGLSSDSRHLGLYVRSVTVKAAPRQG